MGVPQTSDHIQINIRMLNPIQKLPAPSKTPNQDNKDMDVLWTYKIKIESNIQIMAVSKTSDNILIKIKMPIPSQEP